MTHFEHSVVKSEEAIDHVTTRNKMSNNLELLLLLWLSNKACTVPILKLKSINQEFDAFLSSCFALALFVPAGRLNA